MKKLSAELVHPESNDLSSREAGSTSTQVVGIGGGENLQRVCEERLETTDDRRQSRFGGPIPRSWIDKDHARDRGSRDHGRDSLAEPPLTGIESENDGETKSPWH
jgi:hypothetical protein